MTNSETTKTCIACASEIPAGAKLCTHCGTYQNWRRYMNVSSTFLALLVALVTVATPLVQTVAEWAAEDPEITLTQPIVVDGKLSLLATNLGQRPAAIAEIRAEIPGTDWAEQPSLADRTQYIVPNGSHTILVDIPFLFHGPEDTAIISTEVLEFGGLVNGEPMSGARIVFLIKRHDNTEYEAIVSLGEEELSHLIASHVKKCLDLGVPILFGSMDPPSTAEVEITESEIEAIRLGCVSSAFFEARHVY